MIDLGQDVEGMMIGEFKIRQKIGSGGFGVVFRATQDPANAKRDVALKLILPEHFYTRDPKELEKELAAEAAKLARLSHSNIVGFITWGLFQMVPDALPMPYLVTQLVDGKPLVSALRGRPIGEKLKVFLTLCDAIQAAHCENIAHLDLKPENVLVGNAEPLEPIVLDFGIAQEIANPLAGNPGPRSLHYASPEQVDAKLGRPSFRTDVYALGVIAFELLTDALPYHLPNSSVRREHIIEAIVSPGPRRSLQEFASEYDAQLSAIVARALEREPARRYDSPAAFARELRDWSAARVKSALPPPLDSAAHRVNAGSAASVSRDNFGIVVGGSYNGQRGS